MAAKKKGAQAASKQATHETVDVVWPKAASIDDVDRLARVMKEHGLKSVQITGTMVHVERDPAAAAHAAFGARAAELAADQTPVTDDDILMNPLAGLGSMSHG